MIGRGENFWKMLDLGFGDSGDMQSYVDTVFAEEYGNPTALDFEYDRTSDSLSYEVLKGEGVITTMATFMPENAHAKSKPMDEIDVITGKIVPFKNKIAFNNNDLREITLAFNRMRGQMSEADFEFLQSLVWKTYDSTMRSNANTIAYMRDQAVCQGFFQVTAENNPDSPMIGQKFDFKVPVVNRLTPISSGFGGQYWWNNDGSDNTSAFPIADLVDLLSFAEDDQLKSIGAIEVNQKTWRKFVKHVNVKNAITAVKFSAADAANLGLLSQFVNEADTRFYLLEGQGVDLPPFVVRKSAYEVDALDVKKAKLKRSRIIGFADDTFVFRPASNYGIIKNGRIVQPVYEDPDTVMVNERTQLIRTYDTKEKVYWLESLEISLPVLTDPDAMFYFNTLTNPTP